MTSAASAGGHVVIAELEVDAARFDDFVALARGFARACVENEPGCRQFDVVCLDTPLNSVLFFEVYDDVNAFEAHCQAAHLARFKLARTGLIVGERPLRQGTLEAL